MAITPSIVRVSAVLLLCAAALPAHAGKRAKSTPSSARSACAASACCASSAKSTVARTTLPPGAAGMVVGLDAETGQYGAASRAQLLELTALEQEMISRSDEGLVERPLPGGGFGIDLQGRFQEFVIVSIGPNGKLLYQCLDDKQHVHRATLRPSAPVWEDR